MADITNKVVQIDDKVYENMWKRFTPYNKKHKGEKFKVFTKPGLKGDYVWNWRFEDMIRRHDTWWVANKKHPKFVYTINPGVNKGPTQLACEKLLGPFKTFPEFYNKMLGRGYSKYYNDVKTLKEELATLRNLNCVDATQVAVLLAREMGYDAKFVHVICVKSRTGHVYGMIKGKDIGTIWVRFDMAACMSKESKYSFGNVWCADAKPISYNDPWLESDDGKV